MSPGDDDADFASVPITRLQNFQGGGFRRADRAAAHGSGCVNDDDDQFAAGRFSLGRTEVIAGEDDPTLIVLTTLLLLIVLTAMTESLPRRRCSEGGKNREIGVMRSRWHDSTNTAAVRNPTRPMTARPHRG